MNELFGRRPQAALPLHSNLPLHGEGFRHSCIWIQNTRMSVRRTCWRHRRYHRRVGERLRKALGGSDCLNPLALDGGRSM